MTFDAIFGVPATITLPQEIARTILIFGYVVLLLRIAGPRNVARLSAIDALTTVIAGSSLSRALTGNSALLGTLGAIAVLAALHWVITQANARSRALSAIFEGQPVELAANGEINLWMLRAKGMSESDCEQAIRLAGVNQLEKFHRVILDPSGKITVSRSKAP
jgi:uncharacterized membrane protein YcaP (DUF421 family)